MTGLADDPRLRAARRLARASTVTRVFAGIVMLGALLGLFFAMVGSNSSDDRLGFSSISLGVLVIGLWVWSTGTFHGAVAHALPTLFSIDRKLDAVGELLARRDAEPSEPEPAALEASPEPEQPRIVPKPPPPEPERVPCPLCGGMIHPEASRCVHCMRKLPARVASG